MNRCSALREKMGTPQTCDKVLSSKEQHCPSPDTSLLELTSETHTHKSSTKGLQELHHAAEQRAHSTQSLGISQAGRQEPARIVCWSGYGSQE